MSDWIQTYTGGAFHPLDPRVEEVNLLDIGHALSNVCRFAGHVKRFYSVAQHCVMVSERCDPKDALWGLLHDAAEAYIGDMSRPIKKDARMEQYRICEDTVLATIAQYFNLSLPIPESVKIADRRMLLTERRDLLVPMEWSESDKAAWDVKDEPYIDQIIPLAPHFAEVAFMKRFNDLYEKDIRQN